jgi:hypothetical protein
VVVDTSFTVAMDGVKIGWTWDPVSKQYLRSQDGEPHVSAEGVQIAAHTVLEIAATYIPSPVDARSPNAITVGSGPAILHRNGAAVPVTWSRPTEYDPFTFIDPVTSQPVAADTGLTFVELERAAGSTG